MDVFEQEEKERRVADRLAAREKKHRFDLEKINPNSLFLPKGRVSLLQDYPELKEYNALKAIRNDKLVFAWYLGCEGSPAFEYYYSEDPKEKIAALWFAKDKSSFRMNDIEFQEYVDRSTLPEDILECIEIFNTFRIGVRVRMKLMAESMLENFEKVVNVDIDGPDFDIVDKDGAGTGERDYDKIKKYSDTCLSIRNKLTDLLIQVEHGFGVSERTEESRLEDGQSFIDLKHELNKQ